MSSNASASSSKKVKSSESGSKPTEGAVKAKKQTKSTPPTITKHSGFKRGRSFPTKWEQAELVPDKELLFNIGCMMFKLFKANTVKKARNKSLYKMDEEMCKVLGVQPEVEVTREEVLHLMSDYCNSHNLKLEDNRSVYTPNDDLCKLFGMEKGTQESFMKVNGHISRHLKPTGKIVTPAPTPVASTPATA